MRMLAAAAPLLLVLAAGAGAEAQDRHLLTRDGLGAITRDAVIRIDALRGVYPELRIATEVFEAEGVAYSRITAEDAQGDPVFKIELEGGRFRDILILSPIISDENGAAIGLAFADLPIAGPEVCFGLVDGAPYVACPSATDPRLQYLFAIGDRAVPAKADPLSAIRLY